MPLQSGTRLGVYEVLSPLGAGGMGEVYRSRDTKIGREVAINALALAHPGPVASRFVVSRDGQQFLFPAIGRSLSSTDSNSSPIAVVVNWAAALQK